MRRTDSQELICYNDITVGGGVAGGLGDGAPSSLELIRDVRQ